MSERRDVDLSNEQKWELCVQITHVVVGIYMSASRGSNLHP